MEDYPNAPWLHKLLVPLTFPALVWDYERRLTIARADNPNAGAGQGARRRSRYEHQLDEHLLLLSAFSTQGRLVEIGRHRCRAWRGRLVMPAGVAQCRCRRQLVHPWEILCAAAAPSARALHDIRHKLRVALDWCKRHHPRTGWALAQSRARAQHQATATEYYLPRRCWGAFMGFRRVVEWIARVLLTTHAWLLSVIPAPRPASAKTKSEQKQGEHGEARDEDRALYRDQSIRDARTLSVRELLLGAM